MDVDLANTNPEAPNGENLGEEIGAVAGTLYTKAWLLDLLVKLVKTLEGEKLDVEAGLSDDDELDNLLTKLWDVSTETPVAIFLAENRVIDILLPACLNADPGLFSRQVEISLGVLANCVSVPETKLSDEISLNDFYRQGIVGLFSRFTSDADVLIQSCRLLNACFHCQPPNFSAWEDFLLDLNLTNEEGDEPEEFSLPDYFLFILRSSKNVQLLLDVAKLLELLCGNVGRFLYQFAAGSQFVTAVNEAMRELKWSPQSETVSRLINVLYMASTVEQFRREFALLMTTDEEDVVSKLVTFTLKQFPDEERFQLGDITCALASSFSLLLSLLTTLSLANFPVLFQRDDLWLAVRKAYKLLAKQRFDADDEQSPPAVLKLNVIEFVETIRATPDANIEQYVLNKIIS